MYSGIRVFHTWSTQNVAGLKSPLSGQDHVCLFFVHASYTIDDVAHGMCLAGNMESNGIILMTAHLSEVISERSSGQKMVSFVYSGHSRLTANSLVSKLYMHECLSRIPLGTKMRSKVRCAFCLELLDRPPYP